jgi:probable HAF family extracellular repeat protein
MRPCLFLHALAFSCALVAVEPANAQIYTVTDLGTIPGQAFSIAQGINQSGQVTGYSTTYPIGIPSGTPSYAFLSRDGKLLDIGSLGGGSATAYGIAGDVGKDPWQEDEGRRRIRVTGDSETAQDQDHAFLYEDHFMRDLGVLPGGSASIGRGVNSSGEVVGEADNAEGVFQAFLFKHGNMVTLGPLGSTASVARAINDQGDVTGDAYWQGHDFHAFLYYHDKIADLGTLPGAVISSGRAINDELQVTGYSSSLDYSFQHAFLWSWGKMIDLGVLPTGNFSQGNGINSWGQVVGDSDVIGNPFGYVNHAFLYSHGHMYDLNDLIPSNSGWVLGSAAGINDRGEIAGSGSFNGEGRAFLLTLDCKDSKNKNCDRCRLVR